MQWNKKSILACALLQIEPVWASLSTARTDKGQRQSLMSPLLKTLSKTQKDSMNVMQTPQAGYNNIKKRGFVSVTLVNPGLF